MRGRCALCRCRARHDLHGFRVCDYHVDHGEDDRPCPYCLTYQLFDPRWTYTVTGSAPSKLVQRRQVNLPNTIFLDNNGEVVLSVESVPEDAPRSWPKKKRQSVVIVGVGLQLGTTFTITQWASDHERQLFEAITPTLALARKVYTLGWRDAHVLRGDVKLTRNEVPWPTLNVCSKVVNARPILESQRIPPTTRTNDIDPLHVTRMWAVRSSDQPQRREAVWRHNYLNVLDLAMRMFQVEWPEDVRDE